MMKHIIKIFGGSLFLTLLVVGFNNCSAVKFQGGEATNLGSSSCSTPGSCVLECQGASCPNPADVFSKFNYEVPYSPGSVDVLFVIDNSGSMKKELENLGSKFQKFSSALSGKDWQACFITTDWEKERGHLRKWDNQDYILNSSVPSFETVFKNTLNKITDQTELSFSLYEHGIYSAYEAINRAFQPDAKGCFRPGSAKAVVIISDEDELSNGWMDPNGEQPQEGNKPENLLKKANEKFGNSDGFSIHAVAIQPGDNACLTRQRNEGGTYQEFNGYEAHRYAELVTATSGEFISICEEDYSAPLAKMGARISQSIGQIELPCPGQAAVNKVDIVSNQTLTRTFSLVGKEVFFSPILVSGEKAEIQYKCIQ